VWRVFSAASWVRPRERRLASSCSGEGTTTARQTLRPPSRYALRVNAIARTSRRSVLARRPRRDTKKLAGSSTCVSTPRAGRERASQKPSWPASWQTLTGTDRPASRPARAAKRSSTSSRASVAPPGTSAVLTLERRPGSRAPTSHLARLSSRATWQQSWVGGSTIAGLRSSADGESALRPGSGPT
jgi:hypothetical protein